MYEIGGKNPLTFSKIQTLTQFLVHVFQLSEGRAVYSQLNLSCFVHLIAFVLRSKPFRGVGEQRTGFSVHSS